MSNPLLDRINDLAREMQNATIQADARERAFSEWFAALVTGTPALDREQITITRENFRKAMRQAFRAGSARRG